MHCLSLSAQKVALDHHEEIFSFWLLRSRGQVSSACSGIMADGEGLMLAPGQIYIEVEYDYEYKSKDKVVTIRQGEWYMLVKKTNDDWWQVRKEEGTKAFYVPAQYVREVRRALMPPQKPSLRAKPTVLDIRQASDENLNRPQPEMSSFGRPSPSSTPSPSSDRNTPPALPKDPNQNIGSPHHCKVLAELVLLHNNNNQLHSISASQPNPRADSPPFRMGSSHNRGLQVAQTSSPSELPGEGLRKSHNDSESGDELSSSSTEQVSETLKYSPQTLPHLRLILLLLVFVKFAGFWFKGLNIVQRSAVVKEICDTHSTFLSHFCFDFQSCAYDWKSFAYFVLLGW